MSGFVVDTYMAYQFAKRLATPFVEWEAYKRGIIDERGKVLRPRKTLVSREDKDAWRYFDTLVANLKKILEKIPLGRKRIVSIAAALLLLREHQNPGSIDSKMLKEELDKEAALCGGNKDLGEFLTESIKNIDIIK